MVRITRGLALAAMLASLGVQASAGEKKYGPGVTDGEIKIGNTSPYSGPASAFSMVAKTGEAYFRKINAEGGINGRKINFISYDDGYLPPKTVEQTRKLVESDEVLLVFNALGTATNSGVEYQESTADLRLERSREVERSWEVSVDDGIHPELPE
jgi:branched-chain amino acid transport system substrate-binding protein